MHPYVSDSEISRNVSLALAGVAILLSWLLAKILATAGVQAPWWVDTPSVMGFYSIVYIVFDRWVWRVLAKRQIINVPDLDGMWTGMLRSSHDDFASTRPVTMRIQQRWSRILIVVETAHSRSRSTVAGLITDNPSEPAIVYQFDNEPAPAATSTMHTHRGTATLRLRMDRGRAVLEGDYYTSRDRTNYGELSLERTS